MNVRTPILPLLLLVLSLGACTAADQTEPVAQVPAEPWSVNDVTPDDDGVLRILVLHDMEGLSGQEDWKSFMFGMEEYPEGQEMLAADMNAVIDGLFEGGADEVHVVDGHGSTNPEPDYRDDLMDPRVTRVLRDEPFDAYFDLVLDGGFDAVAVVGMHPKFGSNGFAAHTLTLGTEIYVNDVSVTETELVALSFGRVGVPVIFASGDQVLGENLQTMPWIEYVTVKDSSSPSETVARDVDTARQNLQQQARRAVERMDEMKYMAMSLPGMMQAGAHAPGSLNGLDGIPGIEFVDGRVTWRGDDFAELYEATMETFGALSWQNGLMRAMLESNPEAGLMGVFEPLILQWFEGEQALANRLAAGEEAGSDDGAGDAPARTYHGAN